jgi:hypothetical protein
MIPMLACCSCSNQEQGKDAVVHSVLVVKPTLSSTTIAKSYSGVVAESKSVNAAFKTAGQISRTLSKRATMLAKAK